MNLGSEDKPYGSRQRFIWTRNNQSLTPALPPASISLGNICGLGSLLTSVFSAGGPPFFGLLFDYTQSYILSFSIFIGLLFASAFLSLFLHPPKK